MERYEQARASLEKAGIVVTDQVIQEVMESSRAYERRIQAFLDGLDDESRKAYAGLSNSSHEPVNLPYALLINMGMGSYDEETGAWTPASTQVYAFDAEVYDVSSMYTTFLRGINAIVPGAPFTEIAEDLSGMTEEMTWSDNPMEGGTDGQRSVSFCCKGKAYSLTLVSRGDWFNEKMIEETNRILAEQGFLGQLHIVSGEMEQMVILYYGTEEAAERIRGVIGPVGTR